MADAAMLVLSYRTPQLSEGMLYPLSHSSNKVPEYRWLIWRHYPEPVNVRVQAGSAMHFYDIWVARDSNGHLFEKQAPYVTDPYSLDRIARGLPFPVKCCWNGMVVLNSGPFLRHETRVRHAAVFPYASAPRLLVARSGKALQSVSAAPKCIEGRIV